MKIQLHQEIKTLDGKPMTLGDEENSPKLTLGRIVAEALTGPSKEQAQKGLEPSESWDLYRLGVRFMSDQVEPIEITPEEAAMARKAVAARYVPLIAGQAIEMLDPKDNVEQLKPKEQANG